MKVYVLAFYFTLLIIVVFHALIVYLIKIYFRQKAKKMTDMELIKAQIKEWESGWLHKLKYEIYEKEYKNRSKWIPYSDVD